MNTKILDELFLETVKYFDGDVKRIQHFTKVHAYAALIGRLEGLYSEKQFTLETAAIVHDIGIKNAEKKYGNCNGKLQETEGPPVAKTLLRSLKIDEDTINRVCFLVGNHHTYKNIDDLDFQILAEADLIVNFCEEGTAASGIKNALENIFKTKTGMELCRSIFTI